MVIRETGKIKTKSATHQMYPQPLNTLRKRSYRVSLKFPKIYTITMIIDLETVNQQIGVHPAD